MLKPLRLFHSRIAETLFILFGLGILAGCATPGPGRSTYALERGDSYTLRNEKIVSRPLNQVWDELIQNLSKSPFVVNHIEKGARIIHVSYYSDTPEKFVDCGKTRRTYARGRENQEYVYEIAASSSYRTASSTGESGKLPLTTFVNRKTSLDGKLKISVAPYLTGTIVAVNSVYVLTAKVSGSYVIENSSGKKIEGGNIPPVTYTCGFNTDQPNTCNWASGQQTVPVTCKNKGVLESRILGYVK
jgi:hypothetical protein